MAIPTAYILPIPTLYTDADMRYDVEDTSKFEPADDTFFRERLGDLWAKHDGGWEEGCTYEIDRLPEGYEVVKVQRRKGGKNARYDYYVWGHGVGLFDRVATFFGHFLELMEYNNYYQLHLQNHEAFHCACKRRGWRLGIQRWVVDVEQLATGGPLA
ncbi:hypothetical protein MMC30_003435 [Trapelia coarctata]|nr:hypothetical protein [Trapelia coarctata]